MIILIIYRYDVGGGEALRLTMKLENKHGQSVPVFKACLDSLLLRHSDELVRALRDASEPDKN